MDRTPTGRLAKDDAAFRAPRSRAALRCRAKRRLMEIVRRAVPDAASALAAAGVHPVLARIYAAGAVAPADELATDLGLLPSFAQLKGIDQAAVRLADAIARAERLLGIADYAADGGTACAGGG